MQRFPLVRPKWDFPAIIPETHYENVMTVKPVTSRSGILDIYNLAIPHLYTLGMAAHSFLLDSDAPKPISGATLAPLEKNQTYITTAGTGVGRG